MLGNVCSRVPCVYCKEKRVSWIITHSIAHGCCFRCLKNAQAHVMIRWRKNDLIHDSNEAIGLACFRMCNVAYARHSVKIYFGMWCLGQNICSNLLKKWVVCVLLFFEKRSTLAYEYVFRSSVSRCILRYVIDHRKRTSILVESWFRTHNENEPIEATDYYYDFVSISKQRCIDSAFD